MKLTLGFRVRLSSAFLTLINKCTFSLFVVQTLDVKLDMLILSFGEISETSMVSNEFFFYIN